VSLRDKGRHGRRFLTAGGEIELVRRYFWASGSDGVYPADAKAGLAWDRVSPGAKEILCRLGMVQNFAAAARDAQRIGNVPVSRERLRQVVEGQAKAVQATREQGLLPAAWSASQAWVAAAAEASPSQAAASPLTRVYHGTDGLKVPTVTQEEKDKRRRRHITRRQQRGKAGIGNARPLPAARCGSDNRYKEPKVGIFYDQDKTRRHVFATVESSEGYGPLLAGYARQIGFSGAKQTIALVDGAPWIYSQVCGALLCLRAILLDFYHLAEHVHQTAGVCFGPVQSAGEWAAARLEELKAGQVAGVLAAIDALGRKVRSPLKRRSVRLLRQYLVDRLDMLEYRQALAEGWDIGSGPTEAMCKTLSLRLKQPGMKWDLDNAVAMMNLTAMYQSDQAKTYWNQLRHAA